MFSKWSCRISRNKRQTKSIEWIPFHLCVLLVTSFSLNRIHNAEKRISTRSNCNRPHNAYTSDATPSARMRLTINFVNIFNWKSFCCHWRCAMQLWHQWESSEYIRWWQFSIKSFRLFFRLAFYFIHHFGPKCILKFFLMIGVLNYAEKKEYT